MIRYIVWAWFMRKYHDIFDVELNGLEEDDERCAYADEDE